MLELKDISKSYKAGSFEQIALNKINITFRDNEFVCVLGPSGSGKTTLLNVIGGLDQYDSGDLLINGVSTKDYNSRDWDTYRNYEIGFVFQNYNLIPHQSVLSNVELALTLSGISSSERKRRAKEALKDVGLEQHMHKMPNQLSGGQMQRVSIARALVNNPSIIFADEPTGALDTKTSIVIMDILKNLAKDKLVVMVTHNPEIANKYATRVVNLQDGKIISDTSPYTCDISCTKEFKSKDTVQRKKTSMSFLTALSLSFANLLGKWGRTLLTAFAGSIGIIGIAGIMALSTGTHLYISQVETNTLSQYPISITKTKSMLSSLMDSSEGSSAASLTGTGEQQNSEGKVAVRNLISTILSASGSNDLKSFKEYLQTNPGDINDLASSLEYTYDSSPLIFSDNTYGKREVYPKSSVLSSSTSDSVMSSGVSNSSYSGSNMTNLSTDFFPLPDNENLYKDNYNMLAGKWPENNSECVLVLHKDGTIADSLMYSLGFKDPDILKEAVKQYMKGDKAEITTEYSEVSYESILGITFKVVSPADMYVYNSESGIWEDKSNDSAQVDSAVNAGYDLKIVGIAQPPTSPTASTILTSGVNFPFDLNNQCLNEAFNKQIVQDQLSKPEIDVLSGKTFEEESKKESKTGVDLDLQSFVQIDQDALKNVISIDTDAYKNAFDFSGISDLGTNMDDAIISENEIINIISEDINSDTISKMISEVVDDKQLGDEVKKIAADAIQSFFEYQSKHPEETIYHYFSEDGAGYKFIQQAFIAIQVNATSVLVKDISLVCSNALSKIVESISSAVGQKMKVISDSLLTIQNMPSLQDTISVHPESLKDAIKINFPEDKILQLSKLISGQNSRTYESNLSSFGYADTSDPTSITIYAKDFESKEQISTIINDYNNQVNESGNSDKEISYSDMSKLLMNSLTTMIDMITSVLIAFVSISLVVSSIMIGIITYISVLERRKEIGILRAIGARKLDIFNVFNAETFIIGCVAGVLGITITFIGSIPANIVAKQAFKLEYDIAIMPFFVALILILISIALTMLAGLIPSTSAANKNPVEAINS